jgi:hypothetical protein
MLRLTEFKRSLANFVKLKEKTVRYRLATPAAQTRDGGRSPDANVSPSQIPHEPGALFSFCSTGFGYLAIT